MAGKYEKHANIENLQIWRTCKYEKHANIENMQADIGSTSLATLLGKSAKKVTSATSPELFCLLPVFFTSFSESSLDKISLPAALKFVSKKDLYRNHFNHRLNQFAQSHLFIGFKKNMHRFKRLHFQPVKILVESICPI